MVESTPAERDPFRPPTISVMVHCLHCDREYESYLIHWVQELDDRDIPGFWCCPTSGCDGKGFGFDIFPVDPDYRDEQGNLMWVADDDDDQEYDELGECEGIGGETEDWEIDTGRRSREDLEDDIPW